VDRRRRSLVRPASYVALQDDKPVGAILITLVPEADPTECTRLLERTAAAQFAQAAPRPTACDVDLRVAVVQGHRRRHRPAHRRGQDAA